ncbi:hypothetical protein D3OALGA1CA_5753 [Olavius algarvensis associated proteobacterium Delta 3]|nr:hypothetical protein D3OALGA1CA_5753 [Olavius algarvensis associated proteobacterium Delta 3]
MDGIPSITCEQIFTITLPNIAFLSQRRGILISQSATKLKIKENEIRRMAIPCSIFCSLQSCLRWRCSVCISHQPFM